MNIMQPVWRLSIPELFGIPDVGLDDAGVDDAGNLLISDGSGGRVYKISPDNRFDVLPVASSVGLDIAVAPDSSFSLADSSREVVLRYNAAGEYLGELPVPGVITICPGPDCLYALCSVEGDDQIGVYDEFGFLADLFPAPPRQSARLYPGIVNMESDANGNVYVCYGVPPYQIWRVASDGFQTWTREMDYPDDTILIADIAVDRGSQTLWALLACKQAGRQVLDAFSLDGKLLETYTIPHAETLYGVISSAGNSEFVLLDTGTGPCAGEVLRVGLAGE